MTACGEWQTDFAVLRIATDGSARPVDRQTDAEVSLHAPMASVSIGWQEYPATEAAPASGDEILVRFAPTVADLRLRLRARATHFVVEVAEVRGPDIRRVMFLDVPLALEATDAETWPPARSP